MDSMQLPLDLLARSYFLPVHRRLSSVLAAHYDALYVPVSFPPFFNASHLIVTRVEAKHKLKNTNAVDLLSKTKTAGSSTGVRMCWEEAEYSKLRLFVCEHMFLAGGGGAHHPSCHRRFKVSITCLSGPPTTNSTTSPPLPRSSSSLPSLLPLHNYPGNCGVIDCITCSKETLALFNKQLEYAPHVVGEQEEEHIGRKDGLEFWKENRW